MKILKFTFPIVIFLVGMLLLSCDNHRELDKVSLELLAKKGAVKDIKMVNNEFVEIWLDEKALKQGGLAKSYDSGSIYKMTIDSPDLFKTYYADLKTLMPEGKKINYGIEHRYGMSSYIWNWVALAIISAIVFFIPLFIILFLFGKLKFNNK
ncbi:hypothetical protein QQ020_15395 [Fulvivirgaceae bacterium BMA12]|uniref:Lipoprotein n=1 Tax=Agaribacillus aureus TaxID=3051825 RepID=A0ABT8L6T3_9BACT|nr:hypothetical protein [Fulvivirgaceae bacterium BMA12]